MRRLPALARRIGALLVVAAALALWWHFERGQREADTIRAADGAIVRVMDGDSLRVGETEIRIAGIDAPELRQSCTDAAGRPWACGEAARSALERLVRAPGLVCERHAVDRYGRSLAHCRTEAGDIGAAMAAEGLALGAGDPRFAEPTAEMAAARQARRGIWQGAHQHPAEWREAHPRGGQGGQGAGGPSR